jgi:hypothetical protein
VVTFWRTGMSLLFLARARRQGRLMRIIGRLPFERESDGGGRRRIAASGLAIPACRRRTTFWNGLNGSMTVPNDPSAFWNPRRATRPRSAARGRSDRGGARLEKSNVSDFQQDALGHRLQDRLASEGMPFDRLALFSCSALSNGRFSPSAPPRCRRFRRPRCRG